MVKNNILNKSPAKILGLIMVISVILLLNVVSAEFSGSEITDKPENISHTDDSFKITVNVTNSGINPVNVSLNDSTVDSGDASFQDISVFDLSAGESIIKELTVTIDSDYQSGIIVGDIIMKEMEDSSNNESLSFNVSIRESSSLTISITKDLSTTENGTVTVENTGNTQLTNVNVVSQGTADFTVEFHPSSFDLDAGNSKTILISSNNADDLEIGDDNTLNIKATSNEANSSTKTLEVKGVSFCSGNNPGELSVGNFDFNVEKGFGDDDDYWYPLDTVEIEFDVDNDGEYDVEDIEIEICLMDDSGECIFDEEDMDLSDDNFDLDEGDEITVTGNLEIDPDELNKGDEDYTLYVKAQGVIDDNDAEEIDGNDTCNSNSEKNLEIRQEEFIILSDFQNSDTVQCGTEMEFVMDVWNIDDSDIDEDDIHFLVYNRELNIIKNIDGENSVEDIDSLDKEELRFTVDIPEDAEEKTYGLEVRVYDDEDRDDNDIYENSEDDEAIYTLIFKVSGNCIGERTEAEVTADSDAIVSGGSAGENMQVELSLRNNGNEESDYIIEASGYENWASLNSMTNTIDNLAAGDSDKIELDFDVDNDAEGDNSFSVKVYSEGRLVTEQEISLTIESSGSFSIGEYIKDNWYVWLIIFDVLLVLAIVVVAIRLLRRR